MTYLKSRCIVVCLLVFGLNLASTAVAQNVTLFGGNSLAEECFNNSQAAARLGSANRTDLEPCDRAIYDTTLRTTDLVATYVNRGIVHAAMKNMDLAENDYNRAIAISDDVGEAYVNRGNVWFVAKRYQDAVKDYDAALKYGIKQPYIAYLNRGMALETLGDFSKAKRDYQSALELVPNWEAAQHRLERVSKKIP